MLPALINHSLQLLQEIVPVFLVAVIAASLIDRFLPDNYIEKIFNRGNEFTNILIASFLGSLLPICTCGMIPLAVKLHEKGLHWKTLCAFLVAGNACSVPALILTEVMGYEVMWIRLISSVIFGVLVTYIIAIISPQDFKLQLHAKDHHESQDSCCENKPSLFSKILADVYSMSVSFLPWILLAIVIASLVSAQSSDTKLINIILQSDNIIISPFIASVIGFPFYFCAGADIPISQELFKMGVPLGTIISFMLASPGVNITSLMVYKQAIGWKQAWVLIAVSILSAAGIGIIVSLSHL